MMRQDMTKAPIHSPWLAGGVIMHQAMMMDPVNSPGFSRGYHSTSGNKEETNQ